MATGTNFPVGLGRPLETLRIFTALGIRFWDLLLNVPIRDGLEVQARLEGSSGEPLQAVRSLSGVYTFFGLPGLRGAEYPADPPDFGPPRSFSYIVTVRDLLERFLPAAMIYSLDQAGRVLVSGVPDSGNAPRLAYLFSATSRTTPPGIATVRADLLDRETNQPAAWAVLRLRVAGRSETWTGIADERGRVVVLFPYPLIDRLMLGSPPGSGQGSITEQTWMVSVQALYDPANLRFPLASLPDLVYPWTVTPSLRSILEDQQPATIWPGDSAGTASLDLTVPFGQEVVLRTEFASPAQPSSSLTISRGTSPL
jgi:hypothetical protein